MFPTLYGIASQVGDKWWEAGGATGAIAVYQPKGAASLAESYTDLSGNGNNASAGIDPAWDAVNGWTSDGTQWLDTGVTVTSYDWSFIIRFSDSLTPHGGYLAGAGDSPFFGVQSLRTTVTTHTYYFGGNFIVEGNVYFGSLGVTSDGGYLNGVKETAAFTTGAPPSGATFKIFRMGSLSSTQAASVQAFALYNSKLTESQMLAVYTEMEAL